MLGVPFLDRAMTQWFRPHCLDDPVDRLNYFVSSTIIIFFSLMVSAKQYVGSPIQCWTPMEFRGGWEQYAEDYCFIQNTFFIPMSEEIPKEVELRQDAEIGYYQWVPIVLAIQAVMFYIPNWLWKTLNRHGSLDIEAAVADARKLRTLPASMRTGDLEKLCEYLSESFSLGSLRPQRRFLCFRFGNNLGSSVTVLYLFTKLLYLINIVVQLFLLDRFLGMGDPFWGFNMVIDFMHGQKWHDSGVFPRVTMCDFAVRKLANIQRYTIQCVLMINMFNEKIYLFLWLWFTIVLICTVVNFMYVMTSAVVSKTRENSVRTWLAPIYNSTNQSDGHYRDHMMLSRFTHFGLQPDGVLVLRFIDGHAGTLIAREIATLLYKKFIEANKHMLGNAPQMAEEGPHESLYTPEKPLLQPDYKH